LDQANDRGENNVSLKTRLLAGAGSLALAGSMLGVAAPAAHAQPTVIGNCEGQALLATFSSEATKLPISLGDQTQVGVVVKTKLLKSVVTKTAIAGVCNATYRPGDPSGAAGPVLGLTPKAVAGKLIGNAGCATGAGIAAYANAALQWPLSGKVTFTNTQLTPNGKPAQIQLQLGVLGFDPIIQDAINLTGIVLKGGNVGADVTGQIWFNPVKADTTGGAGDLHDTGWELDLAAALGCQDAVVGNANIPQVVAGGGSLVSGIGSVVPGIIFQVGQ
jgi:hypothetical protein